MSFNWPSSSSASSLTIFAVLTPNAFDTPISPVFFVVTTYFPPFL